MEGVACCHNSPIGTHLLAPCRLLLDRRCSRSSSRRGYWLSRCCRQPLIRKGVDSNPKVQQRLQEVEALKKDLLRKMQDLDNRMHTLEEAEAKRQKSKTAKIAAKPQPPSAAERLRPRIHQRIRMSLQHKPLPLQQKPFHWSLQPTSM